MTIVFRSTVRVEVIVDLFTSMKRATEQRRDEKRVRDKKEEREDERREKSEKERAREGNIYERG